MPTGSTSPITSSSIASSLIRTTSIAPSAARMPHRIWAASNAGPAGAAVQTSRSAEPSAISQFVPTSMNSRRRLSRVMPGREQAGDDVAADVGAERREDRWRAHAGAAAGRARWPACPDTSGAAMMNGATPIGSGSIPSASWVIVALPASATS